MTGTETVDRATARAWTPTWETDQQATEGTVMAAEKPEQFDIFMSRREAASNDYIRGDAQSLAAMLTDQDPATFMPPNGAVIEGSAVAKTAQVEGAAVFGLRSSGHFEVLNSASSGDLAFWTGWQIATMDIERQDQPVPMALRTTEVFRRENGHWKLVHRHADIPTAPKD